MLAAGPAGLSSALSLKSSKRDVGNCPCSFVSPLSRRFFTRSARVLNSSSLNMAKSFSRSSGRRTRSSGREATGTSVLMVARNFENSICRALSSIFFFSAPFSLSVLAKRFSIEPKSFISFTAVFSPTPGHPGILSILSPMSARRSITWAVELIPYLRQTSSGPRSSKSCPL